MIRLRRLVEFVAHVPGHKNSQGEDAPWVVKSEKTDEILTSYKSKEAAEAGLRDMEIHKES